MVSCRTPLAEARPADCFGAAPVVLPSVKLAMRHRRGGKADCCGMATTRTLFLATRRMKRCYTNRKNPLPIQFPDHGTVGL